MITISHKQKLKSFSSSMIDIECAHHNLKNIGMIFINLEANNEEKANQVKNEIIAQISYLEEALGQLKTLIDYQNESVC